MVPRVTPGLTSCTSHQAGSNKSHLTHSSAGCLSAGMHQTYRKEGKERLYLDGSGRAGRGRLLSVSKVSMVRIPCPQLPQTPTNSGVRVTAPLKGQRKQSPADYNCSRQQLKPVTNYQASSQ